MKFLLLPVLLASVAYSATANSLYQETVLEDRPYGYWRMSTVPTLADGVVQGREVNLGSAGAVLDASYRGAVRSSPTLVSQAGLDRGMEITGTEGVFFTPEFEKLPEEAPGFSYEFWFRVNSLPTFGEYNLMGDATDSSNLPESAGNFLAAASIIYEADGPLQLAWRIGFGVSSDAITTPIQVGRRYHVVYRWSRSEQQFQSFLNGNLRDGTNNTRTTPPHTGNRIIAGRDARFLGTPGIVVDEIAHYTYPLSDAQISRHYEVGSAQSQFPLTGTIEVTQTAGDNLPESVSFSLSPATSPGVALDSVLENRADYHPFFPAPPSDGVLLTSIAQNGRDHTDVGGPDGLRYATCAVGIDRYSYFISSFDVPGGAELNINPAFGYFPYDQWLGARTTSGSAADSPLILRQASPGIAIGTGAAIVDEAAAGMTTVNLTQLDDSSSANGILLVNAEGNRDNYALSRTESNGTFTVFSKDNGSTNTTNEQGGISFVYLPISAVGSKGLVAMGRMRADSSADIAGGIFTLTRPVPEENRWHLTVAGYSASSGTLLVSPEGGGASNSDNILSYQWDDEAEHWVIESRDNPDLILASGEDDEIMFSFAFFSSVPNLVTTVADENNSPASDGTGISLREAIRDAEAGDCIHFAPDLAGETLLIASRLLITKPLTVDGSGLSSPVTLNRKGDHFLFQTNQAESNLTLINLHLTSETEVNSPKMSLIVANNLLSLQGCEVRGEGTEDVAAIQMTRGTLKFGNCRFLNNGRNTFNRAGGGVLRSSREVTATITDCLFQGNQSFGAGAISNEGSLMVARSTFTQNSGRTGGAIFNRGVAEFSHCTFTGNSGDTPFTASGEGGAFHNFSDGELTLTHCTIVGNTTLEAGGGIFNQGELIFAHTVVAENTLNDSTPNDIAQDGGTVTAPSLVQVGSMLEDNINGEVQRISSARLHPLGDFGGATPTMPPLPNSPLIDRATGSTEPEDQRGIVRDFLPDMGAVELGQIQITTTASELDTPASDGEGISIQEAIRDANASPATHVTFAPALSGATFTLTDQRSAGARLSIEQSIILDGTSVPENPILNGNRRTILNTNGTGPIHLIGLDLTTTASGFAAGIINQCEDLFIDQCAFLNNETTSSIGFAGAIFNDRSGTKLTLQNSTFFQNRSRAGAIYNNNATLEATNCTFFENTAAQQGGAISNSFGTIALNHCTIVGNTAPEGQGGGLYHRALSSNTTSCRNSLITDNEGGDAVNFESDRPILSEDGNFIITGNAAVNFNKPGDRQRSALALLLDLGDYRGRTSTMPPKTDSGLDDLMRTSETPAFGQGGTRRIRNIDRGAVENLTTAELASFWEQDWDGDGLSYGLEQAIGSNPDIPDATTNRTLQWTNEGTLRFTQSASALSGTVWRLRRSTDLLDFETVFESPNVPDIDQDVLFMDDEAPTGKAFYRLEAFQGK